MNVQKLYLSKIFHASKRVEELKEKIISNEHHVNQCQNQRKQTRSWTKKLLKISVDLPLEINDLKFNSFLLNKEIEGAQKLIKLLMFRKLPPRCLFCGATNCSPLPTLPQIPATELQPESSEQFFEVGFTHL